MSTSAAMVAVVARDFTKPDGYALATIPRPTVMKDDDVVIKIHAASVNPVDVKKANGVFKAVLSEHFPYKLGYDAAGVVDSVGPGVKNLKVGDEVYTRLPEIDRGSWCQYARSTEQYITLKPKSLSFGDAASLPLAAVTSLQALSKYEGSLEGKTVFIPAGLSATGAYACQLAKNVFRAGKVITTVSTAKVPKVREILGENVVDEIIDYTKNDPAKVIPSRSVDFLFDTMGQAMPYLSLMKAKNSLIVSISTTPSGKTLQNASIMQGEEKPSVPFLVGSLFDAVDSVRRMRASRWGVTYLYMFLEPNAKDLDTLTGYVEEGKVRPVVGTRVSMMDIEKVKEACNVIYNGKGGLGKTVIEVV